MTVLSFKSKTETTTQVVARCDMDGDTTVMSFPMACAEFEAALNRWQAGTLVQVAFPSLSADHREFLMTGITPEKWDAMFG